MLRSPEIQGDVNLNPPHWFLGWGLRASRGPHAWADGAHVHKFSTVSIAVLRGAYVCTCVTLTPPPDEAVIFSSLLLSLAVATSATGTTGWWRATCLLSHPLRTAYSHRLWHCPDISGIQSSPDKSRSTIIFTDFMQGDWLNWTAAHYSEPHQWTPESQSKQM